MTAQDGSYYQEVDLLNLFKDVAGPYLQRVSKPSQVRQMADRACRTALARRTVTAPVLPSDMLPWVTGPIGLLGSTASWHLVRECDGWLTSGSNIPYSEYYPAPGQEPAS